MSIYIGNDLEDRLKTLEVENVRSRKCFIKEVQ